jgi:hypothetical protein
MPYHSWLERRSSGGSARVFISPLQEANSHCFGRARCLFKHCLATDRTRLRLARYLDFCDCARARLATRWNDHAAYLRLDTTPMIVPFRNLAIALGAFVGCSRPMASLQCNTGVELVIAYPFSRCRGMAGYRGSKLYRPLEYTERLDAGILRHVDRDRLIAIGRNDYRVPGTAPPAALDGSRRRALIWKTCCRGEGKYSLQGTIARLSLPAFRIQSLTTSEIETGKSQPPCIPPRPSSFLDFESRDLSV